MTNKDFIYVVKFLAYFLVVSFVVDKILYYSIDTISENVYSGQSIGKYNHYMQVLDDVDLIIEGSSRANHNIDPSLILENSYNMGMDGQKIASNAALTKILGDRKQTVLFNIFPNNAFNKEYTGDDIKSLNMLYNKKEAIKKDIDELGHNVLLQKFYWSIGYNNRLLGIIRNYIKPKYDHTLYNGYDPLFPTENQKKTFKIELNKTEKKECPENLKLNEIYDIRLDEIKEFCKKNNKTLIFYSAPFYNDQCKLDNKYFQEIMKNKELIYYDFSDFFKENNSFDYWKDESHLSALGAEKFSLGIKDIVLKHHNTVN